MFVYLSKKIAIPNRCRLQCLAWNADQGWIACGGDDGLLKVMKLDSSNGSDAMLQGIGAPTSLQVNQILEGHTHTVRCATWNPSYKKLTTSDQKGLIIVWALNRHGWYEEMINDRNQSVVTDMKWLANGQKICIVYEDGAVVVGAVDGNRLWGKDLQVNLRRVEWSPDGQLLLFSTSQDQVLVYDSDGNMIKRVAIVALDDLSSKVATDVHIVDICWFSGPTDHLDANAPRVVIAFDNGRVQLMRDEDDTQPIILDTKMELTCCRWSHDGTMLAISGVYASTKGDVHKSINLVKFFDAWGTQLRMLKVQGDRISAVAWEGSGLRVALAVDSLIYIANIRNAYRWAYFADTVVYAMVSTDQGEPAIMFGDVASGEARVKGVANMQFIAASGDFCVMCMQREDEKQCVVEVRNAIGAVVESKVLPFRAQFVVMAGPYLIVCSQRVVCQWQGKLSGEQARRGLSLEKIFDIEDPSMTMTHSIETFTVPMTDTTNGISAITANDQFLFVARQSGEILRFTLPHMSMDNRYELKSIAQRLEVNCNSSKLAVIDGNGVLVLMDLEAASGTLVRIHFPASDRDTKEARDPTVWDFRWADDDPDLFAFCEKTKLYIVHNLSAESGIICSGYIARIWNLQVRIVALDQLMTQRDSFDRAAVIDLPIARLRDITDMIHTKSLEAAVNQVASDPHPQLWRTVGEAGLEQLNLTVAERAYVQLEDYASVKFIQQLQQMNDPTKQRAEAASFLGRVKEAESIYLEIDRKDLAIRARARMGDWFQVDQLLRSGDGTDELARDSANQIGEYYADRFKWNKAAAYFKKARNLDRVIDCYYRAGLYEDMRRIIPDLPEGTQTAHAAARLFQSVGMCADAVTCYIKASDPKAAVDCCILLNQWGQALDVAKEHNFPQVEGLLTKYVTSLLAEESASQRLRAVQLYRIAGRAAEAAVLLAELAQEIVQNKGDPRLAKKLLVSAALEVDRHKNQVMDAVTQATLTHANDTHTLAQTTAATLESLMTLDTQGNTNSKEGKKVLENAWRLAAAYHYFILAQRYFFAGDMDAAMKTAIRLCEFDDILEPWDIYSLVALTALQSKFYGVCSKALVKLETLPDLTEERRNHLQSLCISIFSTQAPTDPSPLPDVYMQCLDMGKPYRACTISGRAILDSRSDMCATCRYFMLHAEMRGYRHCPLCHASLA